MRFASTSVYPAPQRGRYTARSLASHFDGGGADAKASCGFFLVVPE